jgi:hypothetical protein
MMSRTNVHTDTTHHPIFPVPADEDDKRNPKAPSAARALYQQQAEIRGKVDVRKGGFGLKDKGLEDKASQVGGGAAAVCCMSLPLLLLLLHGSGKT